MPPRPARPGRDTRDKQPDKTADRTADKAAPAAAGRAKAPSAARPSAKAAPAKPQAVKASVAESRATARPRVADDGQSDKRKQILKAAVKVFAERGYHGCRISDVAEEAGVAYGLVYHYYGNKDGLLASVFDTNWAFFSKAIDEITAADGSMQDKLTQVVELAFSAFEMAPLVVKVLVLEFGRNSRLGDALANPTVAHVFKAIARIFDEGKHSGELHKGIDPAAMSVLFMGALETAFVSFVLADNAPSKRGSVQASVTLDAMKVTLMALLTRGAIGRVPADGKNDGKSDGKSAA